MVTRGRTRNSEGGVTCHPICEVLCQEGRASTGMSAQAAHLDEQPHANLLRTQASMIVPPRTHSLFARPIRRLPARTSQPAVVFAREQRPGPLRRLGPGWKVLFRDCSSSSA